MGKYFCDTNITTTGKLFILYIARMWIVQVELSGMVRRQAPSFVSILWYTRIHILNKYFTCMHIKSSGHGPFIYVCDFFFLLHYVHTRHIFIHGHLLMWKSLNGPSQRPACSICPGLYSLNEEDVVNFVLQEKGRFLKAKVFYSPPSARLVLSWCPLFLERGWNFSSLRARSVALY